MSLPMGWPTREVISYRHTATAWPRFMRAAGDRWGSRPASDNRKVVARKAVLFRAKDQGDAAAAGQLLRTSGARSGSGRLAAPACGEVRVPVPTTSGAVGDGLRQSRVSSALASSSGAPTADRASRQWGA